MVVTTHNHAESWIFVPGDSLCKDHQWKKNSSDLCKSDHLYVDMACHIIPIQKYMDACASALGFFLCGFDYISHYQSPSCIEENFFNVTDPGLWFFRVSKLKKACLTIHL